MTDFVFSKDEIAQFPYLLPVQGSFKTLELTEQILKKLSFENSESETLEISFSDQETELIKTSINYLDSQQKLHIAMLPLIRKLLQGEI